eukprot:5560851-Pleurochrysis_carterae.AAC.2
MPPMQSPPGGKAQEKSRRAKRPPPPKCHCIEPESSSSSAEASLLAPAPNASVSPPAGARRSRSQNPSNAAQHIAQLEKELAEGRAAAALNVSNQADAKRQKAELDKAKKSSETVAAVVARELKAQKSLNLKNRQKEGGRGQKQQSGKRRGMRQAFPGRQPMLLQIQLILGSSAQKAKGVVASDNANADTSVISAGVFSVSL